MIEKNLFRKVFLSAGICLFLAGVALLICFFATPSFYEKKAKETLSLLENAIPQPQGAVIEERGDNTMPVLLVNKTDFVGILELPDHNSVLPVCAHWGKITRYPCHFGGSIYDGSMIIGGSSQKGQYDFYREINPGDSVFFTDGEGNRYGYSVSHIQYEKTADKNALEQKDADLTLFIKNQFAFEYIILFCQAQN